MPVFSVCLNALRRHQDTTVMSRKDPSNLLLATLS